MSRCSCDLKPTVPHKSAFAVSKHRHDWILYRKKKKCKAWESSFVAILIELHPTWLYRKGAWLQKEVISPIKNAKYGDNKMLCLCEFSMHPRGKDASWSWLIGRADPQQLILACGHQARKFVHLSAPTVKIIQSHASRETPPPPRHKTMCSEFELHTKAHNSSWSAKTLEPTRERTHAKMRTSCLRRKKPSGEKRKKATSTLKPAG